MATVLAHVAGRWRHSTTQPRAYHTYCVLMQGGAFDLLQCPSAPWDAQFSVAQAPGMHVFAGWYV